MREPTVASLMTSQVISTSPDTSFKDLVELLEDNGISAVPVVDGGYPVGVVSESDLLAKEEFRGGTVDEPMFLSGRATKHRWQQAGGRTARDVMTAPVKSIEPDAPASTAAHELAKAGVRRLFVVDADGALVGVLSRRDLLKVFERADDDLRTLIRDEVFARTMWVDPNTVEVEVEDGVVTLRGQLERRSEVDIAEHIVRGTPGVVSVENHLTYEWDNTLDHTFKVGT